MSACPAPRFTVLADTNCVLDNRTDCWVTTTTAGAPGGAWLLSFFAGQISPDNERTGTGYVWPVRTGR